MAKQKLKTHKATARRFQVTGSGRFMRDQIVHGSNANIGSEREEAYAHETVGQLFTMLASNRVAQSPEQDAARHNFDDRIRPKTD